ncbi:MAG: hypothetical protein K6E29_05655 [Cyanobacteria bacterium RUI128]|nr:hypothetical protein [Cyanobacteria bacterium RUI128]
MPPPKQKPQQKKVKPTIYINEQGQIINPKKSGTEQKTGFNFRSQEEMFGRRHAGNPDRPSDVAGETIDRMVDFAIIDDIVNGGKGVDSIFGGARNIFRGAEKAGTSAADDIVGAGIAEGAGADIMGGVAEHSSGFMDTLGNIIDSASEGLSGAAESLGDLFESVV